jgi:hypothetical protein
MEQDNANASGFKVSLLFGGSKQQGGNWRELPTAPFFSTKI